MKTTLKNSIPAFLFFAIMFVIALLATNNASAQTMDEPTIAFRYDGFQTPDDAPTSISKERLEDDELMIKEYNHSIPLNGQIGLPPIEEVKDVLLEEVFESMKIYYLGTLFVHLMKDDTNSNAVAHLINEDWDGAHRS